MSEVAEQQEQPQEFKLFTWKDISSNKTKQEACDWFKDTFPPVASAHGIFLAEHKFPEDLRPMQFMNENLVTGYLQDLNDRAQHKVAYAVCLIHGPKGDKKFALTQLWIFNTPEIPAAFQEANIYSEFEWKKLNWETDQEFILDVLVKDKGESVKNVEGTILARQTYK